MIHPTLFTKPELIPTRNGYGEALLELGASNPNVMVLTADLAESTRVDAFRKAYPERFIECGVAEQNMVGIAAGIALSGCVPFVSSYAVFMPGRTWDQIRVSVCYSNANVKLVGAHSGVSVGPDGATHQALEDIAITRVLPNLIVIVPCDAMETKKATLAIAKMIGPAYIRFAREKTPVITTKDTPFEIGKANILRTGKDITIVACGPLVAEAMFASETLSKQGIDAEVINMHTIKPLDTKTLIASVKKTGHCVTVEEHQITGGLFGAVSEALVQEFPCRVTPIGMSNCFGESGAPDELLEKYGMTAEAIVRSVKTLCTSH